MQSIRKDFEKCQNELKVRIWYNGSTEVLDKMLNQQKISKDIGGLGCVVNQCSTRKETSNKDIQFASSNGNEKGQTFTFRNAPKKKIDLTTTGEDMKLRMKNGVAWRNDVDLKGKGKIGEDSFIRSKNMIRQPRRPSTNRRQGDVFSHTSCQE